MGCSFQFVWATFKRSSTFVLNRHVRQYGKENYLSNGEMRHRKLKSLKPSHMRSQEASPGDAGSIPLPHHGPAPLLATRSQQIFGTTGATVRGEGHGIKWTWATGTEHRQLLDKLPNGSHHHQSREYSSEKCWTSMSKTAANWIAKEKWDAPAKRKQRWQQQQMGRGGKENRNTARWCEP